jgi:hypothetical protein
LAGSFFGIEALTIDLTGDRRDGDRSIAGRTSHALSRLNRYDYVGNRAFCFRDNPSGL